MVEKKLKIIVTGALGKLGHEFVNSYSGIFDLVITDFIDHRDLDGLPYLKCDISNKAECSELFIWAKKELGSIDGLVHCGAVSAPGNDQVLTFEVNSAGTFYLLQECVEYQVDNVVIITSGWVQGLPSPEIKPRRFPIDENTVGTYKDVYHISKKFNEMNAEMLIDSGKIKKIISLRLGGIVDVDEEGLKALSTDSYWTRVALKDCALAIDCALKFNNEGFEYFLIGSKNRYGPHGELETWPELKVKLEKNGFSDLIETFKNHESGHQTFCLDKSVELLSFNPEY
ncbi:MAG: hypothetical protein COA79_19410 [Planctomycetota bacterium]|nr:MAG: hypothetical protein COA79_19410 [Planctomycetota bacterium]